MQYGYTMTDATRQIEPFCAGKIFLDQRGAGLTDCPLHTPRRPPQSGRGLPLASGQGVFRHPWLLSGRKGAGMPFIRTKKGKGKVKYKKPLLSAENFSENLCKPVAISCILCKTLAIETDEAEFRHPWPAACRSPVSSGASGGLYPAGNP